MGIPGLQHLRITAPHLFPDGSSHIMLSEKLAGVLLVLVFFFFFPPSSKYTENIGRWLHKLTGCFDCQSFICAP